MFGGKRRIKPSQEELLRSLQTCTERRELLDHAVQVLLYFLKEQSLDIAEIGSDQFRSRIDDLSRAFAGEPSVKALAKRFEGSKKPLLEFIGKEKQYFEESASELRNVISLLRKGLAEVLGDSQEFSSQMYESNVRMERITNLNDLRKMKEGLRQEILVAKSAILKQQARDAMRVESLSKEVDVLKSDLEKVKVASLVDTLTGAHNRLALDKELKRLLERNLVSWRGFSVLMLDIDGFKMVNDTYGHQVGDLVLKVLVQECRDQVRETDFVARYGGEEFVIILLGASLRHAVKTGRRICETVGSKQYAFNGSTIRETLGFTVSVGAAEARKGDSDESLMGRADAALYEAKRSGRNRVASERDIVRKAA